MPQYTTKMAVIKANYTKSSVNIKASIRYIQHRTGKDGQKITRTLFGMDGKLNRKQAYMMINSAKRNTRFYRLIVSPDPNREDSLKDLNLRELTETTIGRLRDLVHQKIPFIAAIHDDHTRNRHIHVIALVPKTLDKKAFQALRAAATENALFQRRERDLALGISEEREARRTHIFLQKDGKRFLERIPILRRTPQAQRGGLSLAKPFKSSIYCPVCGIENCELHEKYLWKHILREKYGRLEKYRQRENEWFNVGLSV